jgi:hypothetical protein
MKFLAVILAGMILAACSSVPSCRDDPRNMRCMSGPELQRELSN